MSKIRERDGKVHSLRVNHMIDQREEDSGGGLRDSEAIAQASIETTLSDSYQKRMIEDARQDVLWYKNIPCN